MELVIAAALAVLAQIIKRWLAPIGPWAVHAFVFVLALGGVAVWQAAQASPEFMDVLVQAAQMLATAVGVYELILKRLGAKNTATLLKEYK